MVRMRKGAMQQDNRGPQNPMTHTPEMLRLLGAQPRRTPFLVQPKGKERRSWASPGTPKPFQWYTKLHGTGLPQKSASSSEALGGSDPPQIA